MSVKDKNGKEIHFGDYVLVGLPVKSESKDSEKATIARVIGISERVKGTTGMAAYVVLAGNARVARFTFDPAKSTLVATADGTLVP